MRKGLIVAAALALSACAGSPENHYFTLSATPPKSPAAAGRPPFHLATVRLPDLYDRPQMVTRTGPQSVDIDEYDRWAESFERMTARILAEDIALRRPQGGGPLPDAAGEPRLQVAIEEFAADRATGQASLAGNWKVTEADGTARGAAFSFTQPVDGGDPAAVAAAMSQLLGRLADEIDKG
jgi:uncharacterized lipoprotein YmbA